MLMAISPLMVDQTSTWTHKGELTVMQAKIPSMNSNPANFTVDITFQDYSPPLSPPSRFPLPEINVDVQAAGRGSTVGVGKAHKAAIKE